VTSRDFAAREIPRLRRQVHREDLAATIYHAFGIPNDHAFRSRDNRPLNLLDEGKSLPLFG